MALKREQEYLVGMVALQERQAEKHYWNIFGMTHRPHNTVAKTLNFEDILRGRVKAKAIPAGGNVPILSKDGMQLVAITPDEIGGAEPFEAETTIDRAPGQAVHNGQVVDNSNFWEVEATDKLGSAIALGKNNIATQIFFDGTFTNEIGSTFDFGLDTAVAVTATDVSNWNIWIADKVRELKTKGCGQVTVFAGSNIIEKLINEINTAPGKNSKSQLTYKSTVYDGANDWNYLETQTVGLDVVQYPIAYDKDDVEIDTSNKIHIFGTKGMIQAHAGVKGKVNGKAKMINTEMWVDIEEGTNMNPSTTLFTKSNPMAGILRVDWFTRYNVTFA